MAAGGAALRSLAPLFPPPPHRAGRGAHRGRTFALLVFCAVAAALGLDAVGPTSLSAASSPKAAPPRSAEWREGREAGWQAGWKVGWEAADKEGWQAGWAAGYPLGWESAWETVCRARGAHGAPPARKTLAAPLTTPQALAVLDAELPAAPFMLTSGTPGDALTSAQQDRRAGWDEGWKLGWEQGRQQGWKAGWEAGRKEGYTGGWNALMESQGVANMALAVNVDDAAAADDPRGATHTGLWLRWVTLAALMMAAGVALFYNAQDPRPTAGRRPLAAGDRPDSWPLKAAPPIYTAAPPPVVPAAWHLLD